MRLFFGTASSKVRGLVFTILKVHIEKEEEEEKEGGEECDDDDDWW